MFRLLPSSSILTRCSSSSVVVGRRALLRKSNHRILSVSLSGSSSSTSTNIDADTEPVSFGGGAFDNVAFIGTGKMAEAMIAPMINTGLQPAEKVTVYDVRNDLAEEIAEAYPGVKVAKSLPEVISGADLVACCVKPQNLTDEFYAEVRKGITESNSDSSSDSDSDSNDSNSIWLSIVAGTPMKDFTKTGFTRIVRSMPNTPAMIGKGMTVWSCTQNMTAEEREKVKQVLCCLGKTIYVDDEKHVDMSTSISGSGPAYIFILMEAMIDAGVHMGFPRDQATTLVYHTLLGSTLYAMETGEHPAILRNSVTSPSGTTASALYELENGKFRTVIKDAMWACYRRSLEMGGKGSNVGPGRHD